MKSNAYLVLKQVLTSALSLAGKENREVIMAYLCEDLIPTVRAENGETEIYFACPGRLPLYRAKTVFSKEPETLRWIDSFDPGDVLWDIGANVGVYSLYAASRGHFVCSFEPNPGNYYLLSRNVELNQFDSQINAYCLAFYDATRLDSFNMANTELGNALNTFSDTVDWRGEQFAPTFRQAMIGYELDEFVSQFGPPIPNHVKIDVDGNEDNILKCARETFSNEQVKSVLVELDSSRTEYCDQIFSWLQECGLAKVHREERNPGDTSQFANVHNYIIRR